MSLIPVLYFISAKALPVLTGNCRFSYYTVLKNEGLKWEGAFYLFWHFPCSKSHRDARPPARKCSTLASENLSHPPAIVNPSGWSWSLTNRTVVVPLISFGIWFSKTAIWCSEWFWIRGEGDLLRWLFELRQTSFLKAILKPFSLPVISTTSPSILFKHSEQSIN